MNAREKLNVVFLSCALLVAIFAEVSCQSWGVFLVILIITIAIGVGDGGIRL